MLDFLLKYGLLLSIAGVFVLAPIVVVTNAKVVRRLKSEHPSVWESLGSPWILTVHPSHAWSVTRFLWRREYALVGDLTLTNLCRLSNALSALYFSFLLLGFSWPFLVLFHRGYW